MPLGGCSSIDWENAIATTDAIDPSGGLKREDYLSLRQRQSADNPAAPQKTESPPPIPALPREIAAETPLMSKRVSLTVSDSVPVRDVLLELMRKADANMELDPRVQGDVLIAAHSQPFGTVLNRICALAGLRYRVEGNFIHVEPDDPYQKTYALDYLSLTRKASSETGVATNVFETDVTGTGTGPGASSASAAGSSSTATQNNSTAKVSGASEADFWAETEKSLTQILAAHARKGKGDTAKGEFSLNKQAGIVTVFGDDGQQRAVDAYFAELRRKVYAQVLIDARIVEVELDDGYQQGIDWNGVIGHAFGAAANLGTQEAINANGFFTAQVKGSTFNGILNLVQSFGTTRVLSAPRVTVLNNQTAVMKVATNQVYFVTQAQFTTTTNANGSSVTTNPIYTSTPRTVPVGLVMTVQPSIDAAQGRVTMTLRPTISRIVGEVTDPSINLNAAVAGATASVQSEIPVLAVREMDSVIQLHSGEIAVLGGLMQDSSINQDANVPLIGDIPYVGNLFKSRDNQGKTSELVVLLRATIADAPRPDPADGDLYRNFNNDPRLLPVPHSSPRDLGADSSPDPTS